MQFFTTNQHALAAGIKVGVHGRSGVGKTFLIKTAPAPFILSAERGTLSLADQVIPGAVINTLADLQEAYNWVVGSHEAKQFQTIAIDSWTEIAGKILNYEKSKSKDGRQAYGETQDAMEVQIRLWRDLPIGKHVYITFQTELKEQPDGRTLWSASMPGKKLGPGAPYFFDEFLYLGQAETPNPKEPAKPIKYRYLQTSLDNMVEAKDRSGALDLMEPPDLNHIFNKIKAKFKA